MVYAIKVLKVTDNYVLIKDRADEVYCMSVTNAAEKVVEDLCKEYGDKCVFYYDTEGDLSELVHINGIFQGFGNSIEEKDLS